VNNAFGAVLPILLILFAVMIVLLPMRARSRMALRQQQLQQSLSVGTQIMTTSGLYGRIVGMDDDVLQLEIAPGLVVSWARAAVGEVRGPDRSAGTGQTGDTSEETGGAAGVQ
jgi:preprotein translocase subunit YajC